MRSYLWPFVLVILLGLGSACAAAPDEPITLRLMTHNSFSISEAVLDEFQNETGITIEIFEAGDGGEALNQAILTRDDPLADVFFGVDNTFFSRAVENDLFLPYNSPALDSIRSDLQLDPENRLLPVDYGDVCLNYDIAWFSERGQTPPQNLADLTDPAYRGLTIVQNPATSTPGLAFLLATIASFGEPGYLDYWAQLRDNDVLVTSGWEEAYYGHFSAASEGDRPIVVSYASSPPAEVIFAEPPVDTAPTAAVTAPQSCFRQIEFVGILRGTEHEAAAREWVDFMLSRSFQEDVPLQMFVFPAHTDAALPEAFQTYAAIPDEPATLAPDEIAANRETWIQAWTDTILR